MLDRPEQRALPIHNLNSVTLLSPICPKAEMVAKPNGATHQDAAGHQAVHQSRPLQQLWELPAKLASQVNGHLQGLTHQCGKHLAAAQHSWQQQQQARQAGARPPKESTSSRASSSGLTLSSTAAALPVLSVTASTALVSVPGSAAAAAAPASETVAAALSTAAAAPPAFKRTSKEQLGQSTWILLHTLAAQLPEKPTRQQQRDVKALIDILTRIYPCGDCAQHWKQIVKGNPVQVHTRAAFEQWLCRSHNVVNRSLGKPTFNCDLVGMAWGPLECGGGAGDDGNAAGCSIVGGGRR